MLSEADAKAKVITCFATWGRFVDGGLAILEEHTITKPYGWVFFYDSCKHIASGDWRDGIAGNGPVVVLADTGEVVQLGTALEPEAYIAEFERARGLGGG